MFQHVGHLQYPSRLGSSYSSLGVPVFRCLLSLKRVITVMEGKDFLFSSGELVFEYRTPIMVFDRETSPPLYATICQCCTHDHSE